MTLLVRVLKKSVWVIQTLLFIKNHLAIILGLGIIAAFGRAIQLGAFGPVTGIFYYALEIIIQSARLFIFLYALGFTSIRTGISLIKKFAGSKNVRKENWQIAVRKVKKDWFSMLTSCIIYSLISFIINLLIDYATYQTCLYLKLKTNDIIAEGASEWVIILFLKNISVIPLTLVFDALFLLWITNRLTQKSSADC